MRLVAYFAIVAYAQDYPDRGMAMVIPRFQQAGNRHVGISDGADAFAFEDSEMRSNNKKII